MVIPLPQWMLYILSGHAALLHEVIHIGVDSATICLLMHRFIHVTYRCRAMCAELLHPVILAAIMWLFSRMQYGTQSSPAKYFCCPSVSPAVCTLILASQLTRPTGESHASCRQGTHSPVQGVHCLQAGLGGRVVGAGRQLGEQCVVLRGVLPVHHLCPHLLLWILLPPWPVLQLGCHSKHHTCSSCSPCLSPSI